MKRALIVGANYKGDLKLEGCVNDAMSMKEFLEGRGWNQILVLTDSKDSVAKPTLSNLKKGIDWLYSESKVSDFGKGAYKKVDKAHQYFFSYSGHGSQRKDKNGDEEDGQDELLLLCDDKEFVDDDLNTLLTQRLTPDDSLFVLIDACQSQSSMDLKYQTDEDGNIKVVNKKAKQTECDTVLLAGSKDSESSFDVSIDNKPCGALTYCFKEVMSVNSRIDSSNLLKEVRKMIKKYSNQTPYVTLGRKKDVSLSF